MVKKVDEMRYQCEACLLSYRNKKAASQCEKHCKKYHACNLDIIKHAV